MFKDSPVLVCQDSMTHSEKEKLCWHWTQNPKGGNKERQRINISIQDKKMWEWQVEKKGNKGSETKNPTLTWSAGA